MRSYANPVVVEGELPHLCTASVESVMSSVLHNNCTENSRLPLQSPHNLFTALPSLPQVTYKKWHDALASYTWEHQHCSTWPPTMPQKSTVDPFLAFAPGTNVNQALVFLRQHSSIIHRIMLMKQWENDSVFKQRAENF